MSDDDLDRILARQMPNAEKTARADYVIVTDTPEHAREQVRGIVADIRRRMKDA
jgi:dephospho-CoA kinase